MYTVIVKGYDAAGNKAEIKTFFTTGDNAVIPVDYVVSYHDSINGYTVTGDRRISVSTGDESLENIILHFPDTIDIYKIETVDGNEQRQRLETVGFISSAMNAEKELSYGSSDIAVYEVDLDGFLLRGDTLTFERTQGLALAGSIYRRPVRTGQNTEEREIQLQTVSLGFPPVLRLSGSAVSIGTAGSVDTYTESGITERGFSIDNVETIQLTGGREKFGGGISFRANEFNNGIDLTRLSDGSEQISIRDVYAYNNSTGIRGESAEELILRMQNVQYDVKHSGLRGNIIDIYEAEIHLPSGYEPSVLTLQDFSINGLTGEVLTGSAFDGEVTISITSPDGSILHLTEIYIDRNGRLLGSGSAITDIYGTYDIYDLVITDEGADWTEGAAVKNFSTTVHGFLVTAEETYLTGAGLFIRRGNIRIYRAEQVFENLGLETTAADTVYHAGTIQEFGTNTSGYGTTVGIKNGRIGKNAVTGTYVIPLPVHISSENTAWEIADVVILANETCAGSDENNRDVEIGSYQGKAAGLIFDGKTVKVPHLLIEAPAGFGAGTLTLDGLEFNWDRIIESAGKDESVSYEFDGWTIFYETILLDESGLGGCGYLLLPDNNGGEEICFPESRVSSDGKVASGLADNEYNTVYIHYLPIQFVNAQMELLDDGSYILTSAQPRLDLEWIGSDYIPFGKTAIDSTGEIVIGEKATRNVKFTSLNRYVVEAVSAYIGTEAIQLSGSVAAQWWGNGSKVQFDADEIMLQDRYIITAEKADSNVTYQYAGWEIDGKEISFGQIDIDIAENETGFRSGKISLGPLTFTTRGDITKEARKSHEEILPGFGKEVTMVESRFGNNGLQVSIFVALPEMLGGSTLFFNPVYLYPDGSLWIKQPIGSYGFYISGIRFDFEGIAFTSNGIDIRQAVITLPESIGSTTIVLNGLEINADKVSIKNFNISPFELWGMTFWLQDFSIENGLIHFAGQVGLPKTMPGLLAGRKVDIKDFRIRIDGAEVEAFEIELLGRYTIPFMDSWALSFENLKVKYEDHIPWIIISEADLRFPQGFMVTSATVTDIAFNPIAGSFDYEKIRIKTELQTEFCGIAFYLNEMTITNDLTVGFGGSVMFNGAEMPEFIAGKTAIIETFEIKRNGTIGDISVSLGGLSGSIHPDIKLLRLEQGLVSLKKEGDTNLFVSVSGSIVFTDEAPGELRQKAMKVDVFTIDAKTPAITELKAGLAVEHNGDWSNDPAIIDFDPILFNVEFNDVYAGLEWNAENQNGYVQVSGGIIFPSNFPDFLVGQEARINTFVIEFDGTVKQFGAGYVTAPGQVYDAFDAIQMKDVNISIALEETQQLSFDLGGTIILPSGKFPEGVAGTETVIRMAFDSKSGLKEAFAECTLPDGKLFGQLGMQGVTLAIEKKEQDPLMLSLAGMLTLPENFPQGLRGTIVNIREFKINTRADIQALDIGAENINLTVFNTVGLQDGHISFSKLTNSELLVDIGGNIKLIAEGLPSNLKNITLGIEKFELSTSTGLRAFTVAAGNIEFDILGGVGVTVERLAVSEWGLSLSANARLPSSYPTGLAGLQFDLKNFEMAWSGTIRNIEGGLGQMSITLAGFGASINKLYFLKDDSGQYYVTLAECRVTLPSNFGSMGGESIAIKNAKFNPSNGDFMGDVEVSRLSPSVCGFTLEMVKPSLEFTKQQITFEKVTLITPDFMQNAEISLSGVKISAKNGLEITGGGVRLPDFDLQALRFSNVFVEFELEGNQYRIGGGGAVLLRGLGELEAELIFRSRSSTYPLGLERAYFSFTADGPGIPLGATGLYWNKIGGGLEYGPPSSKIPNSIRGYFGDGTRLSLLLGIGAAEKMFSRWTGRCG
ncbi:hypothetical protein K7I13_09305 [Brucepastera parasyntrophica]|uniref:hypothetical protein n=1 Tax=Brucepastera parasyntrophica TaxID=2880008 RepID=UPI00210DC0D7|nr:hypothetical protein [Brucepastera parasyntrophica]ULQ58747.1 hypothetical protein K7I13_09305 [Brucepastera parasyntrophica]